MRHRRPHRAIQVRRGEEAVVGKMGDPIEKVSSSSSIFILFFSSSVGIKYDAHTASNVSHRQYTLHTTPSYRSRINACS